MKKVISFLIFTGNSKDAFCKASMVNKFFCKRALYLIILLSLSLNGIVYAKEPDLFQAVLEEEVEVIGDTLNVRTGPGLEYKQIGTVKKGDVLPVIGALGNWYIICLKDGSIGVISNEFIKVVKMRKVYIAEGDAADIDIGSTDSALIFDLSNQIRINNGIDCFIWDDKLNKIAELKALDMERGNYISHYSENYGTPFEMLKQMGISYKSASENIITSISAESGFANLISSPSQRSNILNTRFNKMGVAVVSSKKYGKIIVQLFVEE